MYNKRKIGAEKEQFVAKYLESKGYKIIDTNFYCKSGEIDLIAVEENYLVFVEVKYRKNAKKGYPEEAVDYRKQRQIVHTARYYMLQKGYRETTACRFDVVAILDKEISLIKDAFDANN